MVNPDPKPKSAATSQQHAPVTFQTALRLRPLFKKEREEQIVLEPLFVTPPLPNQRSAVALHPAPPKTDLTLMSPSSALVRQTLSPETAVVATDVEYQFDVVIPAETQQEQVYYALGLPMALDAMAPLKTVTPHRTRSTVGGGSATSSGSSSGGIPPPPASTSTISPSKKTHILIGMGLASSGKTYTCLGGGSGLVAGLMMGNGGSNGKSPTLSPSPSPSTSSSSSSLKRKSAHDGLVPRILDSLYSQSKHHVMTTMMPQTHGKKKDVGTFAVRMAVFMVKESKHKADDCLVIDLLQPPSRSSRRTTTSSVSSLSTSTPTSSWSSASSAFSSFCQASNLSVKASSSTISSSSSSSSSYFSPSPRFGPLSSFLSQQDISSDRLVTVEPDPDSPDGMVSIRGHLFRSFYALDEARSALHTALQGIHRKRSMAAAMVARGGSILLPPNQQNQQQSSAHHLVIQIQPVLVHAASGQCLQEGNTLVVVDMASVDPLAAQASKKRAGGGRIKDANPNRSDAHSALTHCLRTLLHNQTVGTDANLKYTPESTHLEQTAASDSHGSAFKKVPFLQHKLTMLLQPFFSARCSQETIVTLLLTAYPGYRDHAEKKSLLQELESFNMSYPAGRSVLTGVKNISPSWRKDTRSRRRSVNDSSDADDEDSTSDSLAAASPKNRDGFKKKTPTAATRAATPILAKSNSMTYSDSTQDEGSFVPMPPPVAPNYARKFQQFSPRDNPTTPKPSAPIEDHTYSSDEPPPIVFVDFPGVMVQPQSTRSELTEMSRQASIARPFEFSLDARVASRKKSDSHENTPKKGMAANAHAIDGSKKLPPHQHGHEKSKQNNRRSSDVSELLVKLETERAKLLEENQNLRRLNEELLDENDNLKEMLSTAPRRSSISSENNHSLRGRVYSEDDGVLQQSRGHGISVNDQLMQHIAALNGRRHHHPLLGGAKTRDQPGSSASSGWYDQHY